MNTNRIRRGQKDAGNAGAGAGNGSASAAGGASGGATGAAAGAAAGAAGSPGAGAAAGGAKELTLDEIGNSIRGAVKSVLETELPAHLKGMVTEDGIREAVKAALAANKPADSGAMTAEQVQAAAKAAVTTLLENTRREKRVIGSDDDGGGSGGAPHGHVRIDVPVSWTKGNLPLHGKQLMNVILKRDLNHGVDASMLSKGIALAEGICGRFRMGSKALTSTGAGLGDEFVPTDLSGEIQRRLYLASDLYAALSANEIDMPSQPYEFPLSTTRPTFYLETTEGTATTASDPGSGKITLDAKKFMAKVLFSYELDEDSIIPILPWIEQQLAESAAAAFESVILNGDDTATHMDSDTHAIAKAAEKAYKGLRKYALANAETKSDWATGGINAANIRAGKKLMKHYGKDTRNLFLVVGSLGENDALGIAELMTMDKAGPRASILTGSVGSIYNIPILTSAANRENLNASGVYDGTTTTKGSAILFNRTRFLLGRRREFVIEVDRDIDTQQTKVVASFRRAFKPVETPSATVPSVVIGYNYTA